MNISHDQLMQIQTSWKVYVTQTMNSRHFVSAVLSREYDLISRMLKAILSKFGQWARLRDVVNGWRVRSDHRYAADDAFSCWQSFNVQLEN